MEILSAKDLSKYLKINEKKIYQLAREAKLPHTKIGGKIAFAREIIDGWIAQHTEREKHLYLAGSDDPLLRRIVDVHNKSGENIIFYAPVGSINGLKLLNSGVATMACVHILDVEKKEYNAGYVDRYLTRARHTIVHLYLRDQGLYLEKGNPRRAKSLRDVAAKHLRFVNRSQGTGTRLLLDFLLHEQGVDRDSISGYDREVESHLQAGLTVLRGEADAAFGIRYVAHLLDLHFVPLHKEQFELVIPEAYMSSEHVKAFVNRFDQAKLLPYVKEFAGYDFSKTGGTVHTHV